MIGTLNIRPPVRRIAAFVLAGIAAGAGPLAAQGPGAAEDPDSVGAAYSGWAVSGFSLVSEAHAEGPAVPADLLTAARSGLALHGTRGWLGRTRPAFRPETLQQDVRRTRLFLARRGYPDVRVEPRLEPEPRKRSLRVELMVRAGPGVTIAGLRADGVPGEVRPTVDRLLDRARKNERYSDERAARLAADIGSVLQEAGYAKVTVETRAETVTPGRARLLFTVNAGDRYRIVRAHAEGASPDLRDVVEDALDETVGRGYSSAELDRVRRDLRGIEMLRQVQLSTEPVAPGELELRAAVSARPPRITSASIGTWSDHPGRVQASWKHRNLFRRARGFSVGAAWSPNQWQAEAQAWWPRLPVGSALSSVRLAHEEEREDAYLSRRSELGLRTAFRAGRHARWLLEAAVSRVDVEDRSAEDDAFEEGVGGLFTLGATRQTDGTDDLLDPRRGLRTRIHGEASPPGVFSDFPYWAAETEVSGYVPLARRIVLAGRLSVGIADAYGTTDELLPDRRFFAGGSGSMRGYPRRELGPTDSDGQPLGGEARLLAGVEIRARLLGWFGVPLFVDGGQVWDQRRGLAPGGLQYATGSGAIFYTPVGPLRLDAARNVTGKESERDDWSFHFSIGHAY